MPSYFIRKFLADVPSRDGAGTFTIQVLKTGNWKYGDEDDDLIVTEATLKEFKENFDKKMYWPVPVDGPIRGGQAHSNDDAHDGGFVKSLELSQDGSALFARIELTSKDLAALVDEGSLAYCSSELFFNYEDPSTREKINVLSGLGLTNRPFIKGMEPAHRVLNLSEYSARTEKGNASMTEQEIAALKAENARLKEEAAKVVTLTEKQSASEAKQVTLAEQVKKYRLAEQEARKQVEFGKFETVLRNASEKRGALTPIAVIKFAELAEAILDRGVRKIYLVEQEDGDTNSIYRSVDDSGIKKSDLIDMLTETINALPGDMVHVTPTGKSTGDTAMLDGDGQMQLKNQGGDRPDVDGSGADDEDGDEKDDSGDAKKKPFKFSERFQAVAPKTRQPKSAEFYLSEIKNTVAEKKVSVAVASQQVMEKYGLKSFAEVSN